MGEWILFLIHLIEFGFASYKPIPLNRCAIFSAQETDLKTVKALKVAESRWEVFKSSMQLGETL